jgi:hypothetical protein
VRFQNDRYVIDVIDDPTYSYQSTDNVRQYERVYALIDRRDSWCKCGILLWEGDWDESELLHSCIVMAGGLFMEPRQHSVVLLGDKLFVAIGSLICCFLLPSLELQWHVAVDAAACFGIHYLAEKHCLISHGEIEIARLNMQGVIEWKASGGEIFTGEMHVYPEYIDVADFNDEKYRIDVDDGKIRLLDD